MIFKSRDAIGGDFYLVKQIEENIYFGAIDCTGHGVPGALMSMLSSSLFNAVLQSKKAILPSEILTGVRIGIMNFLNQRDKEFIHADGLDAAICKWNKRDNTLNFSGANNPLVIIRNKQSSSAKLELKSGTETLVIEPRFENDQKALFEIKGNNFPVGYYTKILREFSDCQIQLETGDIIITYSDGYKDQFGGERDKRIGNKRFLQLLFDNSSLTLDQQKEQLNSFLDEWKNGQEQIDDICILATRV